MYQEFQRFKQHVEFTFKGPPAKSDKKDCAGWLGMWIGQPGREVYKTFTWDAGQEDDPAEILGKFENYVKPAKNMRVCRFKAHQRKQNEGGGNLTILLKISDFCYWTVIIQTQMIFSSISS